MEQENKNNNFWKILTHPISLIILGGIISYYTNEYLNRDKIEIVEVNVKSKPTFIDAKNYHKFIEYTSSYNFNSKSDTINLLSVENIKDLVKNYSNSIKAQKDYLERLINVEKEDTLIKNSYQGPYYYPNKKQIIEENKSYIAKLELDKQSLIKLLKNDLLEADNDFYIELVVRNKGNQQGILKYKASVSIDNRKINLKKYQTQTNSKFQVGQLLENYITIESKSFNGLLLEVDRYFNNPSDIVAVTKEFELRQKSATITIYAIDRDNKKETVVDNYEFIFRDELLNKEYGNISKLIAEIEKL